MGAQVTCRLTTRQDQMLKILQAHISSLKNIKITEFMTLKVPRIAKNRNLQMKVQKQRMIYLNTWWEQTVVSYASCAERYFRVGRTGTDTSTKDMSYSRWIQLHSFNASNVLSFSRAEKVNKLSNTYYNLLRYLSTKVSQLPYLHITRPFEDQSSIWFLDIWEPAK